MQDRTKFIHSGRRFTWHLESDDTASPPWEDGDCWGVVTEWTRRDKHPGERILCADRGSRRFYDVPASMTKALEVWGCLTRADAAVQVDVDFKRLRDWCNDYWWCVGVIVTDCATGETESLWGIESDSTDYFPQVAEELADALNAPRREAWLEALRNARHARAHARQRFAHIVNTIELSRSAA
jgi:hypothetical protein